MGIPDWFPDSPSPVFWPKSGFLKTLFLKSTLLKNIFGAKNFPDKVCPGSGFALNYPVFTIFFIPSVRHTHNLIPDSYIQFYCQNPVFGSHMSLWSGVRFIVLKKTYCEII